jgi:hypothetical protein
MLAHHAQLDRPQQEHKMPAQIATQDAQHAQLQIQLKSAQIAHLIMGILMDLAHYAHQDKLQLEYKLFALLAPTQDALLVHQQVALKFV